LQEVSDANAWAYDHQDEAAQIYQKNTGIDAAIWKIVERHAVRTAILPVTEKVLQAQQLTADNYYKIGLLPKHINVRECTLTPEQYAQIIPANQETVQAKK
jgi:sulfonate transport system substrate-binding protein